MGVNVRAGDHGFFGSSTVLPTGAPMPAALSLVRSSGKSRVTTSLLSTITGTATDNLGGTYTFSYQLRFRKPIPIPGSGIAIDNFKLTGTGAADGMSTFFRARVTLDSGANPVGFEIFEQTGDPFHCDPL